ncbi:amidase domain-containing protein [Streptomyces sp. RPT161]|uniref:amidase domain-containing protein n=1 Tax=Streptomyces sp. RPT161 TaxID=3015993 RepID=UPI0022B8637A|nr:amidase domain-containing protein [Streptomyces sp. RPT161]
MVVYNDLHDCRVDQWTKAADDWAKLAKDAHTAADDLRNQGRKPLDEHWTDAVGKQAAKRLTDIATRLEAGGDIIKGVTMVVDGLTSSMDLAQRTLNHAIDLVNEYGLRIESGRAVGTYTGNAPTGPDVPQNVRDAYTKECRQLDEVNGLIDEALRQATQADEKASAELDKLATDIDVADPVKALNEVQNEASHTQLDMLQADIPTGKDPHLVREWWDGLSPQEHKTLMLAEPVALANLNGIPDSVKQELRGTDGKLDRVKLVQYALDHWNTPDKEKFDNNCTNFVSSALEVAGMQPKSDFWTGYMGDDTWGHESGTGWDWLDQRAYYSKSWASAGHLQDFLLKHGAEDVPASDVRPGDIIFFEQDEPAEGRAPGTTHHAAVVTAVTPDGDIRYTQHTDSYQNVSLDGRMPHEIEAEGQQKIRIVRPKPDWY